MKRNAGIALFLAVAVTAIAAWADPVSVKGEPYLFKAKVDVKAVLSASAIDAGSEAISGTLGVTGVTTLVALDAGVNSKVGGVTIATAASQDGGTATPLCQFGYGAGSGGVLAVTYTKAFTSVPQCQCTHVGTTNLNACVLTTASQPTTTTASFSVTSGGTDIIDWLCCGDQ